jgi:CRISPR system Cascade subunit CasD
VIWTLRLRLIGPMQSWGTRSRFDRRDTEIAPSKSGVIGLLAAALGRPRDASIADLARLRFGVRIDREGVLKTDFHTAQDVVLADESKLMETAVTHRAYVADAAYLAGLESSDRALLDTLDAALAEPRWPLALGRRAFVPSEPVALRPPHDPAPIAAQPLEQALVECPSLITRHQDDDALVRYLIEHPDGDQEWFDQPLTNFRLRNFGVRRVRMEARPWGEPWS